MKMRMTRHRPLIGHVVAAAAVLVAPASMANASGDKASYVLEFRSRPSELAGHSFVIAKRVEKGRSHVERVAGLRPKNVNTPYQQTLSGVPAAVGTYREDFSVAANAVYTVPVSRGAYARALRKIDEIAQNPGTFNGLTRNCNTFTGEIARAAGLSTPNLRDLDIPQGYVGTLRRINSGGRADFESDR